ncbi:MAG: DUF58 domain-containing protein [Actinomycetales bacterium]|nr:DUF58 domain-containing protein [Actinomycetales bacterium]
MRVRPTLRGIAVGAVGLVLVLVAVAIGSPGLLRLGLLGVVAVVGAHVYAGLTDPTRGPHSLGVERVVRPNPVSVGQRATVRVAVRAHGLNERIRLAGLKLGEQAAVELSGGRPLRARVERSIDTISVLYPIYASRRGRWELGPLNVRHADPLGLASVGSALGTVAQVTVWPAVTDLALPSDALVGEPDRVALGARSPSTDDAALRDYRVGDDLRRVHWRSTARRGALMVRSDERAGMRPASVLLDLPPHEDDAEWTVALGASIALALLGAGHPVRLTGGRVEDGRIDPEARSRHLRETSSTARAELLDLTVDLVPGRTPAHTEEDLLAAARTIGHAGSGTELVFAVVGPLTGAGRAALAPLAAAGDAWALVRTGPEGSPAARDAESSVLALRRAGWRVVTATPGEPHADVWARLLGATR